MKLKNFAIVATLLAAAYLANGAENKTIEIKPAELKLVNSAMVETLDDTKVLKLVSKSAKDHPKGEIVLELDPAVAVYELSYSIKTENIISQKPDKFGADIVLKPAKGGALRFSSRGSYKCDTGSMDWKKVSVKVNAKRYLKEQPVKITLRIAYAPGTAWYKDVKLTPVMPKK